LPVPEACQHSIGSWIPWVTVAKSIFFDMGTELKLSVCEKMIKLAGFIQKILKYKL
jgi:hypothetical protein